MFKLFKKHASITEDQIKNTVDKTKVYAVYDILRSALETKKMTKADLTSAIQDAVSYLGEIIVDP